jgi:hypothetical protein
MNGEALIGQVPERKQGWMPRPTLSAIVFVNLALVVVAIAACAHSDSVRMALGYRLRREYLLVDANDKSLGVVAPGENVSASFRLTNGARNTVRILGCASSCICAAPNDLPFTLAAGESRQFAVTVQVPSEERIRNFKSTDLELQLTLFTSNPTQPRVPLTIRLKVGVPSAGSGPA